MGKILITLTVINRIDQAMVTRGYGALKQVRSITLDNVVVDVSIRKLCLPAEAIAQLGLSLIKEISITTPTGQKRTRIFQDATIQLLGREGTFDCLELPDGCNALLGSIPLATLGIEVDMQCQKLKLLPEKSIDTHFKVPFCYESIQAGKYAHASNTSDDFARRKQTNIDREDRPG